MSKGKKTNKSKKASKKRVYLPKKIKKGQISKKELKPVGMLTSEGNLKSSSPVESISGIGIKRGRILRQDGIETVGEYKQSIGEYFKAKKKKEVKLKPKPEPKPKPKPKPVKKPVKKKVTRPRKGNEYIQNELTPKMFAKPKRKDWEIDEVRKELINIMEAEYGKGSKTATEFKEVAKETRSKAVMWENLETIYTTQVEEGTFEFK
jgi:hypothetical protein